MFFFTFVVAWGVGLVCWRGIDLEATKDEGVGRGEVKGEEEGGKKRKEEKGAGIALFYNFQGFPPFFKQIHWGQCARIKCPNKQRPFFSFYFFFPFGCSLVFPTIL